jgi:microcystin-dependent protein
MEAMLATIVCFAGSYVPKGWLSCDGQLLPINQFQALFSLLGTRYGGDGVYNFNLPDLRGRTVVSTGQSPFHNYELAESAGSEFVSLNTNHLPEHSHAGDISLKLPACSTPGIDPTVNGGYPANYAGAYATSSDSTMLAPDYKGVVMNNTGSGVPLNARSPFVVLKYIICIQGILPPRP